MFEGPPGLARRTGHIGGMHGAPYIHGPSPEEHVRLGHMNQLLNARELVEAGLRPVDATLLIFGACAGMERFPVVLANLLGVVAGATEDIALARTLSAAEIEAGLRELRRWSERPDAALWHAVYAAAVRPS